MSDKICGVFSVEGIYDTNQIKIIHEQNLEYGTFNLQDVLIDRQQIINNVFGEIYRCNITDSFLMSTKKLPLSYINIIYEKPLRRIQLFRMYVYFTILQDITSQSQLLDEPISGKFTLELIVNNDAKQIDQLEIYPGNKNIKKKFLKFVKHEEMINLISSLVDDVDNKLKQESSIDLNMDDKHEPTLSLTNY